MIISFEECYTHASNYILHVYFKRPSKLYSNNIMKKINFCFDNILVIVSVN